MKVDQFVMAYSADHNQIKALLGDGYVSLRPVLRVNVEIIHDAARGDYVRIEHNTPVAADGKRAWLNLHLWESPTTHINHTVAKIPCGEATPEAKGNTKGMTTIFQTDFLHIAFTGVGIEGACPAENDNDGCFYIANGMKQFVASDCITSRKEYCDCTLTWTKHTSAAMGIAVGEILGAYKVSFDRCIR